MELLKERKTPLQSKLKVVAMMELFEKCVDEKIVVINLSASEIVTYYWAYRVDLSKNSVEKVYPDLDD